MPTKKKAKPITIEAIKEALAPSFNQINERFGTVETKLGTVDERFNSVDSKVENLRSDIANLFETQTMKFDRRLNVLKGEIIEEVKVLLENDKRIEVAIESANISSENAISVKDHEERISTLETEVEVLRTVRAP